ncbi:hypothetical protein [Streptomyces sp. NPDC086010]|uniref:hypothetical protein n=1 Tax=Streptomyces sp. NPDC086010 TaxID=3365745 RepID=UPI0037D570CF
MGPPSRTCLALAEAERAAGRRLSPALVALFRRNAEGYGPPEAADTATFYKGTRKHPAEALTAHGLSLA